VLLRDVKEASDVQQSDDRLMPCSTPELIEMTLHGGSVHYCGVMVMVSSSDVIV
jgi:hypothetical protein